MNTYIEALKIVSGLPDDPHVSKDFSGLLSDAELYEKSLRIKDGVIFFSVRIKDKDYLVLSSNKNIPWKFVGEKSKYKGEISLICEETESNCKLLRMLFPDLEPKPVGKEDSTFGVGDRLGVATVGHIKSFSLYPNFTPILAQQSLRELELTNRSYRDVVDAAIWGVFKTGYRGKWGADGDHLKDTISARSALEQGCTMITVDLSDHLAIEVFGYDDNTILEKYKTLDKSYRERIESKYLSTLNYASDLTFNFTEINLARIALTYKGAIDFASILYKECEKIRKEFDFEISVDETDFVTSLEAHFFVANELNVLNVSYTGLAPRYVGEFQKGIDYIGDVKDFQEDFRCHAKLASLMGHKISVHSSSDKFSVYPIIKEQKAGPCHLKTSGTNWLVALQVISYSDKGLFRMLFKKAYAVYDIAKSYYHITPNLLLRTDIDKLSDVELPVVFSNNTDRQVLHVSYGELKKDKELWDKFVKVLIGNQKTYDNLLAHHIGKHLFLLS